MRVIKDFNPVYMDGTQVKYHPVRLVCKGCGHVFEPGVAGTVCPECDGTDIAWSPVDDDSLAVRHEHATACLS